MNLSMWVHTITQSIRQLALPPCCPFFGSHPVGAPVPSRSTSDFVLNPPLSGLRPPFQGTLPVRSVMACPRNLEDLCDVLRTLIGTALDWLGAFLSKFLKILLHERALNLRSFHHPSRTTSRVPPSLQRPMAERNTLSNCIMVTGAQEQVRVLLNGNLCKQTLLGSHMFPPCQSACHVLLHNEACLLE